MGAIELFIYGIVGSLFGFSLSTVVKEIGFAVYGKTYFNLIIDFFILVLLIALFLKIYH